jgi:hypothetical protein
VKNIQQPSKTSRVFRAIFTCLQVMAFIAAIVSAVVAVVVLVNYHQLSANPSRSKAPPGH